MALPPGPRLREATPTVRGFRRRSRRECASPISGSARTWTATPIQGRSTGQSPEQGLLDTSLAVELEAVDRRRLPLVPLVSTLTLAELVSGRRAVSDPQEKMRRGRNLSLVEARCQSLPFDRRCARAFAPIYAAVVRVGRKPRGPRTVDLLIAATALAHRLPLYTLNVADLRGIEGLVEVVDLIGE